MRLDGSPSPTAFVLSTGDGTKTVHAWVKNASGVISSMATAQTLLDTSVPSVSPSAPASSTTPTIAITLTGSDAGSGLSGYFCVGIVDRSRAHRWQLEGDRTDQLHAQRPQRHQDLYAWTKDRVKNRSAAASATIALALPGPTVTLTLPALTRTASIAPTLTTTDPTGVGIAPITSRNRPPPRPPRPLAGRATKPTAFVLSTGDGTKTVHAWVKNASGVCSSMATAQTLLDTSVPSVSLSAPASSTTPTIAITLTGSDAGLGSERLLLCRIVDRSRAHRWQLEGDRTDQPHAQRLRTAPRPSTPGPRTALKNRSAAASATIALAVPGPTVTLTLPRADQDRLDRPDADDHRSDRRRHRCLLPLGIGHRPDPHGP